jgi:GntR family transcriptional regulator / MocR family aminotransferase
LLRTWDLNIQILRDSATSIHEQIEKSIILEIKKGRLAAGTALPGSRALAEKIQVNRKTVILAYENLMAKGWLSTEVKRGTFVADRSTAELPPPAVIQLNQAKSLSDLYYSPSPATNTTVDVIEFSPGLPDFRLLPFNMVARAIRHALITASRNHYQENKDPLGTPSLRLALFNMLGRERGIHAALDQMCIFPNQQMSLHVVAKTLINKGDYVMVEGLCDPNLIKVLENCDAEILYIPTDEAGINVDYIENICLSKEKLGLNICAVYVSPNHQVATSVCMPVARRKKLLSLAKQYQFKIIEDDDGHYFNFNKQALLPMASSQDFSHIIYIDSLAKALSSSLPISYIVADKHFIEQCAEKHALINHQENHILEIAFEQLLKSGQIKKHINSKKRVYEARRTTLLKLVQQELGKYVSVKPSHYGLAFWLAVTSEINMDQLMEDLKLLRVKVSSSKKYAHSTDCPQGLLLGFANLNQDEATEGIKRIKQAFSLQHVKLATHDLLEA